MGRLTNEMERQEVMEGMFWYDNDNHRSLVAKIKRAAAYYKEKYGRQATVCWVSEQDVDEQAEMAGLRIRAVKYVRPNHLVIGVAKGVVISST